MSLATHDRKRLAAILGMLGSNSAGERDNAARMAEEFRRQHSLTWSELLGLLAVPEVTPEPPPVPPAPVRRRRTGPISGGSESRESGISASILPRVWVNYRELCITE